MSSRKKGYYRPPPPFWVTTIAEIEEKKRERAEIEEKRKEKERWKAERKRQKRLKHELKKKQRKRQRKRENINIGISILDKRILCTKDLLIECGIKNKERVYVDVEVEPEKELLALTFYEHSNPWYYSFKPKVDNFINYPIHILCEIFPHRELRGKYAPIKKEGRRYEFDLKQRHVLSVDKKKERQYPEEPNYTYV